jgi:hypothetical protein
LQSGGRPAFSILVLLIIAFLIVMLPFSSIFRYRRLRRRRREHGDADESGIFLLVGTLFSLAVLLAALYYYRQNMIEIRLFLQQIRIAGADYIIDTVIVLAAALIVILLASIGAIMFLFLFVKSTEDLNKSVKRRIYLVGTAFTLGSTFLSAFMLTFVSAPPLAAAKVDGPTSVQGHLLGHIDSYWYIFDRKGNLVATHDDEATDVKICNTTTEEATNICTQGKSN